MLHGGSLTVRTADGCGGPCESTYLLPHDPPAGTWSYIGHAGEQKGYRYRSDAFGFRIRMKPGRRIRVTGRGPFGHELSADPQAVDVTFATGLHRYCLRFGGDQSFTVDKVFRADDAPAPASCAP